MAVPAERLYGQVIMAFIAELLLVRMAFHAVVLKAHGKMLSAGGAFVLPLIVTHHGIPPVVQELHVLGPHVRLGLDAFLFPVLLFPLLDRRGIELRLRLGIGFAYVIVKRKHRQADKDNKPGDDLASIIEFHYAFSSFCSIPGRGSPRRSVVLFFSPFITRAFATSS